MENTVMIVWDGCDSYILSDTPIYKGSQTFRPSPAVKTDIDPTDESVDLENCVMVDDVVYRFV